MASSFGGDDPFADMDDFGLEDPFAKPDHVGDPFAKHISTTDAPAEHNAAERSRASSAPHFKGRRGTTSQPEVRVRGTVRETSYLPLIVVLVGGVIAMVTIYLAFLELRPLSFDPLGNALLFLAICSGGLVLATVAVLVAIRSAMVGRPRHRPLLAIVVGLVLVPLLVIGSGTLGLNEAKRSFQDSAAFELGPAFVTVLGLLKAQGVELGPLDGLTP